MTPPSSPVHVGAAGTPAQDTNNHFAEEKNLLEPAEVEMQSEYLLNLEWLEKNKVVADQARLAQEEHDQEQAKKEELANSRLAQEKA
jgi:hypothetical protein